MTPYVQMDALQSSIMVLYKYKIQRVSIAFDLLGECKIQNINLHDQPCHLFKNLVGTVFLKVTSLSSSSLILWLNIYMFML
jgi:hypothetical protein